MMADQDFDVNSVLLISYETGEPERNTESSPAPKSPKNGGAVLGLVPDEDWEPERNTESSPAPKSPKNEGGAVLGLVTDEDWCEEKSEVKAYLSQHILNRWDCNTNVIRDNFTQSSVEISDVAERQVSTVEHYRCTTCSEVFSDFSLMSKHSRTHPPRKKPFACNICGKQVTELCNLKRHIRFHTGEAALTCKVCHKKFHTPETLKTHMRFHSGDLPNVTDDAFSRYRCHICMRPFARQNYLNKHFRIHSVEKQFLQQESTVQQVQQQS